MKGWHAKKYANNLFSGIYSIPTYNVSAPPYVQLYMHCYMYNVQVLPHMFSCPTYTATCTMYKCSLICSVAPHILLHVQCTSAPPYVQLPHIYCYMYNVSAPICSVAPHILLHVQCKCPPYVQLPHIYCYMYNVSAPHMFSCPTYTATHTM